MKKGGKCDKIVRENKRKFQDVEESESKKKRKEKEQEKERERGSKKKTDDRAKQQIYIPTCMPTMQPMPLMKPFMQHFGPIYTTFWNYASNATFGRPMQP